MRMISRQAPVSFDSMSFSEAVGFVQLVWVLIDIMLLSIPFGAIYAIFRGRSNHMGLYRTTRPHQSQS